MELHARLGKLERRILILVAVLRLLLVLVRISGCRLNGERLPDGKAKADNTPGQLATARKRAREERLAANRALSCEACAASGASEPDLVSAA